MLRPEQRSVSCPNGLSIACQVYRGSGREGKTPIISLHGYLDNSATWELCAPALTEAGHDVIAMDFPGHGKSGHVSQDSWYSLLDYPQYVMWVAKALLGDKCFSLLGHSLGGGVALLVAASFPERVQSLVMVEAIGPFTLSPTGAVTHLKRSFTSRETLLAASADKVWPSPESAVKARVSNAGMGGNLMTITEEAARRLVMRAVKDEGEGRVSFTHDSKVKAYSPGYLSEDAVKAFLAAVKCPCLAISGATGFPLNSAARERMAILGDKLSHAHLSGSHHLHLDAHTAPEVLAELLLFYRKVAQEASDEDKKSKY
ncbi:unnamed protein product [Chrysoparadoxa australica]